MSGFAGIVCADGRTPDAKLLEQIVDRLAFRGPDATQVWTRPGAGFCFTFLRTGPAPQANSQPCTVDGKVWLLGDVRLDGRHDLRRELEQSGERIENSATDEELILRTWRQWGEEGLAKLLGDFSFVLWDESAHQLRCIRDLIGARPFYYAKLSQGLCFSNALEVLRLVPGISSVLDPEFIADFLLEESCSDASKTAYSDIRRLPAGHELKYAGQELRVRRYAALPIEEPLSLKHENEYVERFNSLLRHAVRERLPRELSGIFLSGGLDSTSLAAVACAIAKQDGGNGLRAYTIDCGTMFKDQEGALAAFVAKHLDMDIETLSGASCLPYEGWDDSLAQTPEPYHEPFLFLSRRQYRQVQSGARVALSGYGGDDILAGQAWPYLVYLFRRRDFKPMVKTFGSYVLRHGRIPPLREGFRSRLRQWLGRKDHLTEFPKWLEPRFVERCNLHDRWRELQEPLQSRHPLHPVAHAGLSSDFWAGVFDSEDAACTGVPVDLRAPLLDQRLLRFLLRVPPLPWCMHKELLREAMRGTLPENVRTRPKVPVLGDSIKYFIDSKKWNPLPLPQPASAVREYVDWKRLGATLENAAGSSLWVGLRPVSLSYWLKGIVNGERIG